VPALDPGITTLLLIVALSLNVLLAVAVGILGLRLRKLRRDHRRAFRGVEDDVLTALGRHAEELAGLRSQVADANADALHLRELLRTAVSKVAIVRYDAFDDMGGALSFSAALLDEHGTGMVISAINGRTETRAYAKAITAGRSDHSLSAEEIEAVEAAIEGRTAVPPTGGRRRRRAS
jgi:hypothetical protein